MKTLLIAYGSQYGYTEQYARWLAEDLGCRALPVSTSKGSP